MVNKREQNTTIRKKNLRFDKLKSVSQACRQCHTKIMLDRKNTLLQEINHRVKNNLQMLSSILSLELNVIKDDIWSEKISDCITRIKTMALLHEKLYSSDSYEKIEFGDFIQSLITDLYQTYNINYDRIKFRIESGKIFLETDVAVPCGMIINEALTNSFKYAFPGNREGEIFISFIADDNYRLTIRDTGVGLASDKDCKNGFGMNIISSLVKQLQGDLTINGKAGLEIKIKFPYQSS